MAGSSIQPKAALLFFLLIILQVPLFRVPCSTGICTTPLQVTMTQVATSGIMPVVMQKALLYPGACVGHLYKGDSVASLAPLWNNLLEEYNLTNITPRDESYKYRLEVVAGSYFAVGGAVVSMIKPGRMSMFGILLIIWGLIKDDLFDRPDRESSQLVHADFILFIALALAVLSIKYDMNKVKRITAPIAKPLKSSKKSKIN
ncbi:hypothetical protein MPTK1_5g10080 [Marchantia polymorpha subsp. ruderalis]|uniref:Uncharacterized protein n=2 Tax=Marchantia polymorpha TaxID=3197 RepID=A0A176WFR2_MARPO|nr:hypothetical protein AXG93_4874s1070 [Marchantia polymorpha subsp. ruderalis]PTQ38951.1 hypothetical protein MARPO_0048s0064 [Marchantia polymorpha]BBN11219.1 hypothetical protein Mp_5g10080 [Marchantia polymorpha subsp. ruderalis]|eukprot:PTQ38951.1 hypothetical protein MARPO_0048s0064 [Marchantia polymorpha]